MYTYSSALKCSSALTRFAECVAPFEGLTKKSLQTLASLPRGLSWAAGGIHPTFAASSSRSA